MCRLLILLFSILIAGEPLNQFQRKSRNFEFALGPCVVSLLDSCHHNQTAFYLYRGGAGRIPIILDINSDKEVADYNAKLTLKILIHGYAGNSKVDHTAKITKEYVQSGLFNVVVVDWSGLARMPCYPTASINTRHVGRCTGLAAARLRPSGQVHAVGFSLGAHVAAFASNFYMTVTGRQFNRITGLDPALPLFATPKSWMKLDSTDANFVDVIHTNAGVFGKVEPSGHIDFYVNGVTIQPTCTSNANPPLCSHMMAALLFAESINSPTGFWAAQCSSFFQLAFSQCEVTNSTPILMGEHVNQRYRGIYLVRTRSAYPFALGPDNFRSG